VVEAPPSVAAAPQVDILAGKTFPIDAYKLTPDRMRQLNNGQTRLVNRCLQRFGYPPSMPEMPPPAVDTSRRYGITDPAAAAKYGYQPPAGDGAAKPQNASPPSAALAAVLYGSDDGTRKAAGNSVDIPVGGCMGEAKRQLKADRYEQANPGDLATDIEQAAGRQAEADERVKTKIAEWSACMRAAGYFYPTPFDAVTGADSAASKAAEVQTAVTDVKCKQKVNLIGVWFTVESAYEQVLIDRNQDRLTDLKAKLDAALQAAAAVA
jgi:hypothetical protein